MNNREKFLDHKISRAEKYRDEVINYLSKYITLVDENFNFSIPREFLDDSILIYDDIIDSVSDHEDKENFEIFYASFGERKVKSSPFTAAAILYFSLANNNKKISQKKLAEVLNLSEVGINSTFSLITKYLKKIPKCNFIFSLIQASRLTADEYKALVKQSMLKYIAYLKNSIISESEVTIEDKSKIMKFFSSTVESMEGEDKFGVFFNRLVKKKPKILAAALCFVYLKYEKDIIIKKREFFDVLTKEKECHMPRSNFTEVSHQFVSEFFTFDLNSYQVKVEKYLIDYLNQILLWYMNKNNEKESLNALAEKIKQGFTENAMKIFDIAIENDFPIILKKKNQEIDYYYPQIMAFSLIYFTAKITKGIADIATPENLKGYFGDKFNFMHINDPGGNRLYKYIEVYLGRYRGQEYTSETFIEMMKVSLEEFYHIETEFLLELFKLTDFTPVEFGNELNIHGTPGTSGILRVIKKQMSFTEPQTFSNIKRFIKENLSKINMGDMVLWIDNIQKSKQKDFVHESVTYPFRWNESRLKVIDKTEIKNGLYKFLNRIWRENFPRDHFMSGINPRASMLKFLGTSTKPVKINDIRDFFKNDLIKYDSSFFLCRAVQDVFKNYIYLEIGKRPKHKPILSNIIIDKSHALAIEVPVWRVITNDLFFIGHIDLLDYYNGYLIVGDYKEDEGKILKSLPQIMAYGLMIIERLEDFGVKLEKNLICVGFSKNMAYSFDPNKLYPRVLEFIRIKNSERSTNLKSRKVPKLPYRTDLYDDVSKLK